VWHDFSAGQKIKQWQADRIDTLIVTSFEQLKFFVQQIPSAHENWLHSLLLMVPSQRVAQLASQLGFHNIHNLESATNISIINAIKGELKRKIV
jgi:uroporphyrinogen-III synthase